MIIELFFPLSLSQTEPEQQPPVATRRGDDRAESFGRVWPGHGPSSGDPGRERRLPDARPAALPRVHGEGVQALQALRGEVD